MQNNMHISTNFFYLFHCYLLLRDIISKNSKSNHQGSDGSRSDD